MKRLADETNSGDTQGSVCGSSGGLEGGSTFTLKLGNVTKEMKYSPIPGNPVGGFVYFNLNNDDMVPFIDEACRLIGSHLSKGGLGGEKGVESRGRDRKSSVLVTPETSTIGMAYVLRKMGYTVHILPKKCRPDGRPVLHETYCAVTSTTSSTLYIDPDIDLGGPDCRVVFFDNVCTTGETLRAAARLLLRLPRPTRIAEAIVLYTEGTVPVMETRVGEGYVIPLTSFGHLPIVRLEDHTVKPQYTLFSSADIPTAYGVVSFHVFTNRVGQNAVVVVGQETFVDRSIKYIPQQGWSNITLRIHDACMTSECFHSVKCDCREQLETAMEYVGRYGGMVVYLMQEGRGIGLGNKILVYDAQEREGLDTVEANRSLGFPDDLRSYHAVYDILKHFDVYSVNLMTNNQRKIYQLQELGIVVSGRVPIHVKPSSVQCERYLNTKSLLMGHLIPPTTTDDHRAGKEIRFYEPDEEHGFLSNFYMSPITIDDNNTATTYKSVEHYYQSQKFVGNSSWIREKIISADTPASAFKLGQQYDGLKIVDWHSHKKHIMFKALMAKFNDPTLRQKLLLTANAKLIEASKNDYYWGEGEDKTGYNFLGDLLMRIRTEHRKMEIRKQ